MAGVVGAIVVVAVTVVAVRVEVEDRRPLVALTGWEAARGWWKVLRLG